MIFGTYTLFTRIPVFLDEQGNVLTDALWRKDLELHFEYIPDFRLCCPVLHVSEAHESACVIEGLKADRIIALRKDRGWGSVFKNLAPNFLATYQAARVSDIVHSGGAGWAFPLSFFLLPMSFFLNFQWVIVIESSFWMKPTDQKVNFRQWLSHHIHKKILGACLRRATAKIFTQTGYRRFFNSGENGSLIAPAVWVNSDNILSETEQLERIDKLDDGEIRLLFPARLVADKGVQCILEAATLIDDILKRESRTLAQTICLDLLGDGPLREQCEAFSVSYDGTIKIRVLDVVPYGEPFFDLLKGYHAVILANRKHEQPRVIFDAFSQGLPVISSSTEGVREIVKENINALLFEIGNPQELAEKIVEFSEDPSLRQVLTMNSLQAAKGYSHAQMHKTREQFLKSALKFF